jgi:hypothetical protein
MNFYNEILPFVEYLYSIRKLENYLSVDLKLPIKWEVPRNIVEDSSIVAFEVGETSFKGISFVSVINQTAIDDVLSKITKIIKFNKEKEIKEKLFKQVIENLKSTFEKNDLNKLSKLYFDFEEDINLYGDHEPERQNTENSELVESGKIEG